MATLQQTPLHALHAQHGARFTEFAGYDMPVQFVGIMAEHKHARSAASLFDVSHMGQCAILGANAQATLEALIPSRLDTLKIGQSRYTVLLNEAGGIVDDIIVTRREDGVSLVVNAGRKAAVVPYLQQYLAKDVTLVLSFDKALLALQGAQAAAVMQRLCPSALALDYMHGGEFTLAGKPVWMSRSGYTGEDGFEISVSAADAVTVASTLLAQVEVKPAGLGARDTLRLEAGLPLYGHELDETISPYEAGLAWIISKDKREKGGFLGAARLQREAKGGAARKRLGLSRPDNQLVRDGAEILLSGAVVGTITSGGISPTLGTSIALGLINSAAAGQPVYTLRYRGRETEYTPCALPFVAHKTFKRTETPDGRTLLHNRA